MKQFILLFVTAIGLSAVAVGQEGAEGPKKEASVFSWQGYLVDAKSAREVAGNPETAMKNAAEYTRGTALKTENQNSGFGIVTDGKWLKFDDAGNKQAVEILKATKKEKGIIIIITGRLDDETVAVTSIKEYLPDNSQEVR